MVMPIAIRQHAQRGASNEPLSGFPRLSLDGEPVSREGIARRGHASLPVSAR
ncbi:MAG TPA: hypothetical protein VLW50_12180 [Streptosporangiaceae bacterium]|nr:hypothetical protein [Streptosporangiaceae bacterium]